MENEIPPVNRVDNIREELGRLEGQRGQSYQYVDILTGTVELYDIDTGERLLDYTPEE